MIARVGCRYDNTPDHNANDDHPPHEVREGEFLIASVYNAVRKNEALWLAIDLCFIVSLLCAFDIRNSTLIVLYFDEHGGLFDHVCLVLYSFLCVDIACRFLLQRQ